MNTGGVIARWREVLPEELFELPVFLLWRLRPKPGKPGKFDKIPHYASGVQRRGVNGSAEDRSQLVDLGDALAAYQRGGRDGIGMALLSDIPVWALDLDNCIDANGRLSPLAQAAAESGSYCERSPSGRGIRAMYTGKAGMDAKNHEAGVEVFDSRGFVTLTGDTLTRDALTACPPTLLAEIVATVQAIRKISKAARTDAPAENPALARSARLPLGVWRRLLDPYPHGADRSAVAFGIAAQLCRAGVSRELALELLSEPQVLAPALDRRGADITAARDWMWQYVVLPAFQSGGSQSG